MLCLVDFLAHSLPPYSDILDRQIARAEQGRFGLANEDIEQLAEAAREFLGLGAELPFPVGLALERMRQRIPFFRITEIPELAVSKSCFWPHPPMTITGSGALRRLAADDTGQRYVFCCLIGHVFLAGLLPAFPFSTPISDVRQRDAAEDARCQFGGALLIPKTTAVDYAGREPELAELCKTSVKCAQARCRRMIED